jgi:hypothetical protein
VTVLGDTSATEMDATNAKGYYLFDLTQAETNADTLLFSAKSSTANIVVLGCPACVFTTPPNFSLESIDANGRLDVIKVAGTTQTAGTPDVNAKLWNGLTTVALPLVPTTAGRTLDVSAGGEAGLDWANVGSPTTVLGLTNTTVGVVTLVTTATTLTNLPSITAGWLTATGIAADAITAAKIADGAIDAATFAAGAINAAAIAADAITDAKVARRPRRRRCSSSCRC